MRPLTALAAPARGGIFSPPMRLTSSFAVFRAEPGEEELSRARWQARDGRPEEAEQAYREVLARHPALQTGWIELFDLVRRQGRHEDALGVAEDAVPLALRGAALSELGRTREAVAALEAALERDVNLALAWHELAHAAYRVGEYSRALLAIDRAFTLEPHTDTLLLRGRVLRAAGQFEAAEVAFEGAAQAADYDVPRREAEREVHATRRAAAIAAGRRPGAFSWRERLFADAGSVVLEPPGAADLAASIATALACIAPLVRQVGWHPAAIAAVGTGDEPLAAAMAAELGADLVAPGALDPADRPMLIAVLNDGGPEWRKQVARLARWHSGTAVALVQRPDVEDAADLVGTVSTAAPEAVRLAAGTALAAPRLPAPDLAQPLLLAASPQAPWRRRIAI